MTIDKSELDFGYTPYGSLSDHKTVVITNNTFGKVCVVWKLPKINGVESDFTVDPMTVDLPPSSSHKFKVYFKPLQSDRNYLSGTHSLTHLLTHSLAHLLTHSLTYLLTHSLTYLLTYLFRAGSIRLFQKPAYFPLGKRRVHDSAVVSGLELLWSHLCNWSITSKSNDNWW
jgi:hypothetical protein